jgi:hypothetical protein
MYFTPIGHLKKKRKHFFKNYIYNKKKLLPYHFNYYPLSITSKQYGFLTGRRIEAFRKGMVKFNVLKTASPKGTFGYRNWNSTAKAHSLAFYRRLKELLVKSISLLPTEYGKKATFAFQPMAKGRVFRLRGCKGRETSRPLAIGCFPSPKAGWEKTGPFTRGELAVSFFSGHRKGKDQSLWPNGRKTTNLSLPKTSLPFGSPRGIETTFIVLIKTLIASLLPSFPLAQGWPKKRSTYGSWFLYKKKTILKQRTTTFSSYHKVGPIEALNRTTGQRKTTAKKGIENLNIPHGYINILSGYKPTRNIHIKYKRNCNLTTSLTKKGILTRLGKGKGKFTGWISFIRPGNNLFEFPNITLAFFNKRFYNPNNFLFKSSKLTLRFLHKRKKKNKSPDGQTHISDRRPTGSQKGKKVGNHVQSSILPFTWTKKQLSFVGPFKSRLPFKCKINSLNLHLNFNTKKSIYYG